MAVNLLELLNDLEAKAKAATRGKWRSEPLNNPKKIVANGFLVAECFANGKEHLETEANASYIAACSPETVLAFITALREAREVIVTRVRCDVTCGTNFENDVGENMGCTCGAEKARDWLAKYPKGEK